MVVDFKGPGSRWRLPPGLSWLDSLHELWCRQRGDLLLPDGDSLFLTDLAECLPNLMLAHREAGGTDLRIEFAGVAARAVLGENPINKFPERARENTPLAWIGAGYSSARHLHAPGAVQVRRADQLALHLPYTNGTGAISLMVSALARWPGPKPVPAAGAGGRIVAFR